MAANIHLGQIDVRDDGYLALASAPTVMDVTLVAHRYNDNPITIRVDGGEAVQLPKGQSFRLRGVDLSTVEAMGSTWDKLLVTGFSR